MTKDQLATLISAMISDAGSGHYASSMSALDIMYPLFYDQHISPDTFILSKGHAAPALYAILHDLGYITKEQLSTFRQYFGLPGHPSISIPGVSVSSGSLGMGISKAIGLGFANPHKTYHVLVGDGEMQEGSNWEALLYMSAHKVNNVEVYIDCNNHQYSGPLLRNIHCICTNRHVHGVVTKWQRDNKYLTAPNSSMSDYQGRVFIYTESLIKHMGNDERIIVLNADLEHDFQLTMIKYMFPDRYIQCGICEQHMVSMAGGLARVGKIPITHTFGAFYRRAYDQIYNNGCDGLTILYVAGLCGTHPNINVGVSHDSHVMDIYGLLPNTAVSQDIDYALGEVTSDGRSIMLTLDYAS